MDSIKITTWNVQHAHRTFADMKSSSIGKRERAIIKMKAIAAEIAEIDANILFVCEGPKGEATAEEYFATVAPDYNLVKRGDPGGRSYRIEGVQWLWFLVRKDFPVKVDLLPVETWRHFTEVESRGSTKDGKWPVSLSAFDANSMAALPAQLENHDHYRHPQVAFFEYNGKRIELIGVHLKSKYVDQKRAAFRWTKPVDSTYEAIKDSIQKSPGYMIESVRARGKLSSEATDIRNYIERRFKQEDKPAIILMGDVNDGPGKELIERWYMLHDLIGNLQGDVFFAKQFLNHALFDIADKLRWSVHFKDAVDPSRDPHILLDHILFTQALSGPDAAPLRVRPGAGRVEHDIHERVNSLLPSRTITSDHRPISVTLTQNSPPVS